MTQRSENLSFWDHLEEFRSRLVRSVLAILAACGLFYPFIDDFLAFLTEPLGPLYFISPAEAFMAHVLLMLLGGTVLASPVVFYQVWAFVAEALRPEERKYVFWCAPFSLALFLAGVVFAYVAVLPISLKFLLSFASRLMIPMITVYEYLSFVGTLCLAFGVIFEMPLVVVFLSKIGIASPAYLAHIRRHVIVGVFILSALITPPDMVSQVMMAVPLIILYELSVVLARMTYRRRW